jgi:hypothetical protein
LIDTSDSPALQEVAQKFHYGQHESDHCRD